MSVGRICIRYVDLTRQDETVQVAARRMHDRMVGTLVVCDDSQHPVGILTDRDLAIRVVGAGRNPATTTVRDVMTKNPQTVREDTPIESALKHMRAGPFRRMPVVNDNDELVGVVSLDDILALLTEEFRDIGSILEGENPGSLAKSV